MDIELSEDLRHYKESVALGLTAKQLIFSILALGIGTAIVLLLYDKIGMTVSCYLATPFVVPLALTGFYDYHGLTFWQFAKKMVHFSFFNRPLIYGSTESFEELVAIFTERNQELQKAEQEEKRNVKKEKEGGDVDMIKKKALRMVLLAVGLIAASSAAAVWYKYCR